MNEIKETIAILKARWPEVSFLIILYSLFPLGIFLPDMYPSAQSCFIFTLFLLSISLIPLLNVLFLIGFIRTAYTKGPKRHSILALLQVGKHFLLRILYICLILGILIWSLGRPFSLITKHSMLIKLCFLLASLIFIKYLLFLPAIIIVYDCRFSKIFGLMKKCKLSDVRELIALFLVSAALASLWKTSSELKDVGKTLDYALTIVLMVLVYFIWFVIWLIATRYVGSLSLAIDNNLNFPDSENKINSSMED